jgi:hypothetical protein
VNAALLLCGLLVAQPAAEAPIAGRPTDWSGVSGGPYVVRLFAEPTELAAEDQLTLFVRIGVADEGSAGNLAKLRRPALAKMDAFKSFAIDDLDENATSEAPPRWFRYLLRPRNADVNEIPRLKFVYFNPRTGRYQTTYSEPVPLTVRQRTAAAAAVEVPPWIMQEWKDQENEDLEAYYRMAAPSLIERGWRRFFDSFGIHSNPRYDRLYARDGPSYWTALALAAPPLFATAWYAIWRRRNPDAARLAKIRRSRAGAAALRTLGQLADNSPQKVRHAIEEYLHARAGLPPSANTPSEIVGHLHSSSFSPAELEEVGSLLRRCDDALFAPSPVDVNGLSAQARNLILNWDDES